MKLASSRRKSSARLRPTRRDVVVTELIFASVPLIPKFASEVPQGFANFGIGTLGAARWGRLASPIGRLEQVGRFVRGSPSCMSARSIPSGPSHDHCADVVGPLSHPCPSCSRAQSLRLAAAAIDDGAYSIRLCRLPSHQSRAGQYLT